MGRKAASEGDERLLTAPTDNLIPQTKGTALEFLTTPCPPCFPKMEDTGLESPWNKGAWEEMGIRKAEQADSSVHGIIVKMEQMVRKKVYFLVRSLMLYHCWHTGTLTNSQYTGNATVVTRLCGHSVSVLWQAGCPKALRKWLPYFRARGFDKGFIW